MPIVLFIDMLGARRQWQTGGVSGATYAFNQFAEMVVAALREEDPSSIQLAGIETDAAMLMFDSALPALRTARRLFAKAFLAKRNPISERLWFRGSLVRCDTPYLRREAHLRAPFDSVAVHKYAPEALDAISIEKSGFKGMRLLVQDEAVDATTRRELRLSIRDSGFEPVRKLKHGPYPLVQNGSLSDFLWMATGDATLRRRFEQAMSLRLRQASSHPEEFAQAAATQVMFHEYQALIEPLLS